jgi:hypothetical protein
VLILRRAVGDRAQRHQERVVVSPEDPAQLEETIAVFGDPEALADLREADAAYERGDGIWWARRGTYRVPYRLREERGSRPHRPPPGGLPTR